MLQTSNAAVPSENMVTYKFKVTDLADLFESFTPEQSHIALEGALNIIFGRDPAALACVSIEDNGEVEPAPSEEDAKLDYETQIVGEVAYALYCHQMTADAAALFAGVGAVSWEIPDDYENSELYQRMEEMFRGIVTKIATDISADKFNQDVITLHGEMEFFSHIELFTYNYNSDHDMLSVTITAMMS